MGASSFVPLTSVTRSITRVGAPVTFGVVLNMRQTPRCPLAWVLHMEWFSAVFVKHATKHAKAAPFKRNDKMLEVLPIGVMVFPGTGIQNNLADKARMLGIPVWGSEPAAPERRQLQKRQN